MDSRPLLAFLAGINRSSGDFDRWSKMSVAIFTRDRMMYTTDVSGSLRRPKMKGFSLIELLIAVGIVSILAAIAVPSYRDYITRGRIPQATSELAARRVQAEQYFLDNRTYANTGTFVNPACVNNTSGQYFDFSCTAAATANAYRAQAVGKGPMAGFTFTIDQAGARATPFVPAGWTASNTCWITGKGGTC